MKNLPNPTVLDHLAPPSSRPNPLSGDETAWRLSSYLGTRDDRLTPLLHPERAPTGDEEHIHTVLREKILAPEFPCVAAKSALNRRSYRLGVYSQMAHVDTAKALCHDLYEFGREFPNPGAQFVTFMAVFRWPEVRSELHFEQLMWKHLQLMHLVDMRHYRWNDSVSSNPDHKDFSYSIGGRPYFLVGFNPQASRLARQLPWAMMVFNLHEQFDQLRDQGRYDTLKNAIRDRDLAYQGSINPVLRDFGDDSEARQYSGREVESSWKCPFHAKIAAGPLPDAHALSDTITAHDHG